MALLKGNRTLLCASIAAGEGLVVLFGVRFFFFGRGNLGLVKLSSHSSA